MSITVSYRNLKPRRDVNRRAESLYGKMEAYLDPAASATLLLSAENDAVVAEATVQAWSNTFRAEETDDELRTAMDKVMHKLNEQVRRFKDKRSKHRGAAPSLESELE